MVVSPIFYMGNKRKLIQKGLTELFPTKINRFIEPFAGSCIVSMNTSANEYYINDKDKHLYDIYNMFKNYSDSEIIERILFNIDKFGLKRVGVKQNSEESKLYKERYMNFRNYVNTEGDIIDLYSCIFYAFSQQMRFNNKGEFNMPFGNGAFTENNENYIKEGSKFFRKKNVYISNNDSMGLKAKNIFFDDFVYLDPPYFSTTATYNENGGWTKKDEEDLYKLCEELNNNNIKFGISNVFENKGIVNQKLIDWCDKNKWNVHTFDNFTYTACGKGNGKTKEVFICNY